MSKQSFPATKQLSYLASPYNDPDPSVMEYRAKMACRTAGQNVFSPIAHNVALIREAGIKTGWERWQSFDEEMLKRCDLLIVLCLDGWERSKGVKAEITFAKKHGIPAYYLQLPE